jgi:bifunctional non-homologous end joining protein LigD
VILGVDGIADFNALHSRQHDEEVQLCAFDILVEGGTISGSFRYTSARQAFSAFLARRPKGIFVNPFERGEIGPELFRAACRMGREGGSRNIGIGGIWPGGRIGSR